MTQSNSPRQRSGVSWRDNFQSIAETMAEALRARHPGWETATADTIQVDDLSGFGGGKAYRLTVDAEPFDRFLVVFDGDGVVRDVID